MRRFFGRARADQEQLQQAPAAPAATVPYYSPSPSGTRWRAVPGFPDYQVSDTGRVRSYRNRRIVALAPSTTKDGYLTVELSDAAGVRKRRLVHRLVLSAFDRLPLDNEEASHRNGKRDDNRLSNLQWVTHAENVRVRDEDHQTTARQERNGRVKLSALQVIAMRTLRVANPASFSYAKLGQLFGVNAVTARDAVLGVNWRTLELQPGLQP